MKPKKNKEKIHGNRIREILQEIGMTQRELADLSLDGMYTHLNKIINGKRRCISLPIAMKIAMALNKPVEEIFILKSEHNEAEEE
jgi:DNA-binding XRE family transcriptional regulator